MVFSKDPVQVYNNQEIPQIHRMRRKVGSLERNEFKADEFFFLFCGLKINRACGVIESQIEPLKRLQVAIMKAQKEVCKKKPTAKVVSYLGSWFLTFKI